MSGTTYDAGVVDGLELATEAARTMAARNDELHARVADLERRLDDARADTAEARYLLAETHRTIRLGARA